MQGSGTSEFGLGYTRVGRFLLTFVWADPFPALPAHSTAWQHTSTAQHLGTDFHPLAAEPQTLAKVKGKNGNGGLDQILSREASSTSFAHAQPEYTTVSGAVGGQGFSDDRETTYMRFLPSQSWTAKHSGKAASTEQRAAKALPSTHTSGWSNSFPRSLSWENTLNTLIRTHTRASQILPANSKRNLAGLQSQQEQLLQKHLSHHWGTPSSAHTLSKPSPPSFPPLRLPAPPYYSSFFHWLFSLNIQGSFGVLHEHSQLGLFMNYWTLAMLQHHSVKKDIFYSAALTPSHKSLWSRSGGKACRV